MRPAFLLSLIVLLGAPLAQLSVQYAELVPQLISNNADPDCQSFITYSGQGDPGVEYFVWDSNGSIASPAYSGKATCVGPNWATGRACHSGFFNPKPLSGTVHCAIQASIGDDVSGKCSLAAKACQDCPVGCGDKICSGGENSRTCAQDCLFYGPDVKVLSPDCYAILHRGERFKLSISARNGGAPLTGAAVSASGPFGNIVLLDDGKSGDGAAGDGIYSGTATVPRDALGVFPVRFSVKAPGISEERDSFAWVSPSLGISVDVGSAQTLGDVVSVQGKALAFGNPANGEAITEFYSPSGKLAHTEKINFSNGSFAFYYHSTLEDETGNWSVRINVTDEFGNFGAWAGAFSLSKLSPGSFLEVEHISPVAGAYSRGATVSVSVKVKRKGSPFSGAKVFFVSPSGQPIEMPEVSSGIYGAPYAIKQSDPLGAWAIATRASGEADSGTVEGGSSYKVSIAPSIIRVEITRPERGEFSVGDSVEIVATANYPDGEPVNASTVYAIIGGDKIHMEQAQPGAFFAYYAISESKEGEIMLTVDAQDEFGNSGSKGATISVSGTSLLYLLDKNRFIAIPAAIALLIAFFSIFRGLLMGSRRDKLLKRKEQVTALQAKVQSQYLKEGSIDRKAFYDLSAKYDAELQRIEHELSEAESRKGGKK